MKVCVPVTADGQVDPRWGRADRAEVACGEVRDWQEYIVAWGTLHDQGTEGAHHARVARFLRDNGIQAVGVHHVGSGMQRMLGSMAIRVVTGLSGDAAARPARLGEAFASSVVVEQAPAAMATGCPACIFIHCGRARNCALMPR